MIKNIVNRIKQIGLVFSFVAINLLTIFLFVTFNREVDNDFLFVIGNVFWFFIFAANGYSHGKLITNLNP